MRRRPLSFAKPVERRRLLKAGLASAAVQMASPFLINARGEEAIKIGMIEPLTGVYAHLAKAEVAGAELAAAEVNRSGGILGRQAQLLVEDSANEIAVGVAKTRQLIDRDHADFILGDVNSAVALATMRVTAEKRKLHIVTGGHTDEITGRQCSWNVFRICKTATMEANAIADTLVEKFGKRWFFLTPDYAYGRSLQAAFERKLRQHGGTWASDTLPLGTVDYSDSLLKAGSLWAGCARSISWVVRIRRTAWSRLCAFTLTTTWRSPARCSNWRASSRCQTRRGSGGGRWNGGGTSRLIRRSRHSTKRSAAAPAERQARGTGSVMPRSIRWRT